ncbi:MAG: hypothetical protein IJH20_04965 [Bacilli bacterium]|nr:hypothetical protein [Bacilli bacterium]
MEFRNKKNEIFDLDGFEYYSSGECAKVYRKDDIAFKLYNFDCKYRLYLSRKVFEILKTIKSSGLVELIDYYHNSTSHILPMDAYSMKFIDGKEVELITAPKEYLSDVLTKLDETIKKLSDRKIVIFDTNCDNILFKENGATIIDPDQFFHSRLLSKKTIYELNKQKIFEYFISTIMKEMKEKRVSYLLSNPYKRGLSLDKCVMNKLKGNNIYESITI